MISFKCNPLCQASRLGCVFDIQFSNVTIKIYVDVFKGAQKNRLIDVVLSSTQNMCLNWIIIIQFYDQKLCSLFAYCEGGNFNIYFWAWFGYFILSAKQAKSGSIYNFCEELTSCLGRANVRAFHENPNCKHTEFKFIDP